MDQATLNGILVSTGQRWNEGACPWGPERLAELYADEAMLYGGRPDHSVGKAAICRYFETYTGILSSAVLTLHSQHVRSISHGAFVAQGCCRFDFEFLSGGRSHSVLRTTLLLVRADGEWKILQHHFSPQPAEPPLGAD
jgi:uncharacterized protein (TIGR02246 family)